MAKSLDDFMSRIAIVVEDQQRVGCFDHETAVVEVGDFVHRSKKYVSYVAA